MTAAPTPAEVDRRLAGENLDEWLRLWAIEQGPAKPEALELMAAVVPPPAGGAAPRVLDLACGPGDVGRAIHRRFPGAVVDCVDRDLFLTALCAAVNRRDGVPGEVLRRDLNHPDWAAGLAAPYDVVAVGYALHWLALERARQVVAEVAGLLRPGGLFVFMEPVRAMSEIREGHEAWRAAQPPQHHWQDWLNFWTRINDLLGYDHIATLGSRDDPRIGDDLTVSDWLDLVREGGLAPLDVLWRDAEKVIVAAWLRMTSPPLRVGGAIPGSLERR